PDFALSATPGSQTVAPGNSTSYTVSVSALNGFNGTVGLSVSGLPTGATATLSPTSLTASHASTLNVATSLTTPAGSYTLTVTVVSGRLTPTRFPSPALFRSPDFALSATPGSQTVAQGNSTSYTVSVSALNGFSGTVGLSASGLPTGATATFSPTSVTGSGSSMLNVTTSSTTPLGSYTLTIFGASGSLTHSVSVTLAVTSAF